MPGGTIREFSLSPSRRRGKIPATTALRAATVVGKGRKYDLQMRSSPLEDLRNYDCVLVVTDHSCYDYAKIVEEAQLVVDTRNATKGMSASNVVRC